FFLVVAALILVGRNLPSEWRPLSEGCRAELAEIIVYARVLAIHREPLGGGVDSLYNSLPVGFGYGYEGAEDGLLYSAEVELLCDQAWGSMLEVPAGSRLNFTGLGYLSCQSHTVMENYSYFFFLRMDENYNILPHGVNFQDAIFPDTAENRRTFSSLFQFSNCTQGSQPFHTFSPEWDTVEDSRVGSCIHPTSLPLANSTTALQVCHLVWVCCYGNPCFFLDRLKISGTQPVDANNKIHSVRNEIDWRRQMCVYADMHTEI
uniref:Coiled-coil domain containing 3a n=1 Tax=Hippocampus comes TaxID=109280 RepID=A0A3Q2YXU8_HIPCM